MKDDLISRQAAIDALGEQPPVWDDRNDYEIGRQNQWNEDVIALKALPSAQPQKVCITEAKITIDEIRDYISKAINAERWIPCSERLPKYGKQVLCCNKQGSVFTSAITYTSGHTVYFGQHYNVIAWMPLPEPYKTESEDKE